MIVVLVVFALILYRMGKGVYATFKLLSEPGVVRALPRHYVVRLPLRNVWIGVATACLVVGVLTMAGTAVLPSPGHKVAATTGWLALWIGIFSSWTKVVLRWWRRR